MTLHKNLHTPLRLAIVAAIVGAGGLPLLGTRWTVWLVLLLSAGLIAVAWILWYGLRGPGAVLAGLERRWLALPGARSVGPCRLVLPDGVQPVHVSLGRAANAFVARVNTPLPESTLTFRVWPSDLPPPSFVGSATRDMGLDLARAHEVEQRFSMLLRAESNAPAMLQRNMTAELLAALLTVRQQSPAGAFRGVTWDGRELGVHWSGAAVTDPERALALSRRVWRALVAEP